MKNHRLVWSLIAVVALALTLSAADAGLAKEHPAKPVCGAQGSQASGCQGWNAPLTEGAKACPSQQQGCSGQIECASTRTCCPKASASSCASKRTISCQTACVSRRESKCRIACSGVCGPRCREMVRREAKCSCGKISCRFYGRGCGNKRVKSWKCGLDCSKPCCAGMTGKRVKVSKCPPGCQKPCCSQKKVIVLSGTDGECISMQNGDGMHEGIHAFTINAALDDDDQERKVKKIRIKTAGPEGEKIIVRQLDPENDDHLQVWQSDDDGGAWLGVYLQDLNPDLREAFDLPEDLDGALVTDVVRSGPARTAGIRKGFVVVKYDGNPVRSADDLIELVGASESGDRVELVLNRKGHEVLRRVTLGKMPQERIIIRGQPDVEKLYLDDDHQDLDIEIPKFDIELPKIKIEHLEQLGEELRTLHLNGAYLGVSIEDASDDKGALVTQVHDGTPADEYGIEEDDVIIEIDGDDVEGAGDLVEDIRSREPGETVILYIERDGRPMKLKVELGERESAGAIKMISPKKLMLHREGAKEPSIELQMKIKELEKELKHLKKKLKELEE